MTEFNTNSFLIELDSFGKPPQQKLLDRESGIMAQGIAEKLNMINLSKQMRIRGEMIAPSDSGMIQLGKDGPVKREQIKNDDVQKWRNDVLTSNRPRINNSLNQNETAESAREYARKLAGSMHCYQNHNQSYEDLDTRSSSATNSLSSPSGELCIKTDSHSEGKFSDYSSSSSQKSPSPLIHSSYSDYASLYKIPTTPSITSEPKSSIPLKAFNNHFRKSGEEQQTAYRQKSPENLIGLRTEEVIASDRNNPSKSSVSSLNTRMEKSLAEIISRKQLTNASSSNYGMSLSQQVRLTTGKPPTGKPCTFRPITEMSEKQTRWKEISSCLNESDKTFEKITKQLQKDIEGDQKIEIGLCANCRSPLYENEDRYTVQDNIYHRSCFTCEVCGRELRDQQFYLNEGRLFCKQDYLYSMDKKITKCAECKEPIEDMVLSALNKKFHPSCFRCSVCGICLNGVPFALDKENNVYCVPDYYDRFAHRCKVCKKPILPDKNTGETVRIVAFENDYHVDCYVCEGCGLRLSEEPESRCYPLGTHLLCEKCHMHWRRSGERGPISDL